MPNVRSYKCLNEDAEHSLASIMAPKFFGSGRPFLKSDCDEQLLMHFAFNPNEAAHVSAIGFRAPVRGVSVPNRIRILVNEPSVSFSTAERTKPVDEVSLEWRPDREDAAALVAVALLPKTRALKAYTIQVWVVDNKPLDASADEDSTVLSEIALLGDMSKGMGTTALPQKG